MCVQAHRPGHPSAMFALSANGGRSVERFASEQSRPELISPTDGKRDVLPSPSPSFIVLFVTLPSDGPRSLSPDFKWLPLFIYVD